MFCDPLFFILLVNILALVWAVRSWRKTIQEKWMNNLRDSAADIIGSSELIYGLDGNDPASQLPVAPSAALDCGQRSLCSHSIYRYKLSGRNEEANQSFAEEACRTS